MIHFCNNDGKRIAQPGLCKSCDSLAGQEEVSEMPAAEKLDGDKKPAGKAAKAEPQGDAIKKG